MFVGKECVRETMGGFSTLDGYYKPVLAMVVSQGIYAAMALSAEAALAEGMKPMVFVVYRQAIGAAFLLVSTILARGGIPRQMNLSIRAFGLLLVATLLGCTLSHYYYYQGLSMTSSSMATAMTNTVPAITFVMAASVGQEKVGSGLRSTAKVLGTVICVVGAFCITFLRGPQLLNTSSRNPVLLLNTSSSIESWVAGSLFLIASSCGWGILLVMQSSVCKEYPDALSLSTLMCFLATSMSALLTLLLEQNLGVWKITSLLQLFSCLFAGIFCSGVCFYLQSWCISMTGPLFPALFDPLCTLITTALASILLREKLYVGGLVGAVAIVMGLYVVLWGKAEDFEHKGQTLQATNNLKEATMSADAERTDGDLSKPLLAGRANNA